MFTIELTILGNVTTIEVTQDLGPVGGFIARIPNSSFSYWGQTVAMAVIGCLAVAFSADLVSQYSSISQ
jgi:cell division protein FtsX